MPAAHPGSPVAEAAAPRTDLGRMLLVSPHLDDGVFAYGELLARHPGAVVLTVCAALPPDFSGVTDWDLACGFSSSRAAHDARLAEDDAALKRLQATPRRLDFADAQYGRPADPGRVAHALLAAVRTHAPDTVLLPLGLYHGDHLRAHEAALLALRDEAVRRVLAYEDVPYRALPGVVQQRLAQLLQARMQATPLWTAGDAGAAEAKRRAVECYASQLRGLAAPGRLGRANALAPERCWELRPAEEAAGAVLP